MNSIVKYLQETRAELRHVAWPTNVQTAIYTVIVALLSVGVALYLGLFDFIFTTTLTRTLGALPAANPIQIEQTTNPSPNTAPLQPIDQGPLNIVPGGQPQVVPPAGAGPVAPQN